MAGPRYIIVGRSRDCDLILRDGSVSGRHARLTWRGPRIRVEDLGSANGVFLKGKRVTDAEVRPGEDLRLGSAPFPWSERALKPFLRQGARGDTVAGVGINGQRFICGACGSRGVLPEGYDRGALKCGSCGASLTVGRRRRRRWMFGAALAVAVLMVGSAAAVAVGGTGDGALSSAVESLGIGSGEAAPRNRHEESVRLHTAPLVMDAMDPSDTRTRNAAVQIAATEDGPFSIEQVASIWTHVRGRWRYVNDPRGSEYFASAEETIRNDFAGDCDDFAIVLGAMITSIGGEARIVMMDGPAGGHAYAEACVQQPPVEVRDRLSQHYRRTWDEYLGRQRVREVHYRPSPECPVWLNLDWNAGVPGGAYGGESWAVAIYPDGRTETLAPAPGSPGNLVPSGDPGSAQPPTP